MKINIDHYYSLKINSCIVTCLSLSAGRSWGNSSGHSTISKRLDVIISKIYSGNQVYVSYLIYSNSNVVVELKLSDHFNYFFWGCNFVLRIYHDHVVVLLINLTSEKFLKKFLIEHFRLALIITGKKSIYCDWVILWDNCS